jgi:hypothetical protein
VTRAHAPRLAQLPDQRQSVPLQASASITSLSLAASRVTPTAGRARRSGVRRWPAGLFEAKSTLLSTQEVRARTRRGAPQAAGPAVLAYRFVMRSRSSG